MCAVLLYPDYNIINNFHINQFWKASQDSTVVITTDYGLENQGSTTSRRKIFPFFIAFGPALGHTQPPIKWVSGGGSFFGGKAAGA
jgi:hypothetical protein